MRALLTVKNFLFVCCLVPFFILVFNAATGNLGANPIEKVRLFTGDWTLYFLLITLTITPLRKISGWNELIRYRRMLGLYAFFYACLHFFSYLILDQFFDWEEIGRDIIKRPYITIGVAAFVLLIPMAVTSTNKMMKRLGKNWKKLHSLIYLITTLGVLHFLWLVKADIREPVLMGIILISLLILRLPWLNNIKSYLKNRLAEQS
ncbi:MAG: sulfoxide reductase heme-binding subunit YedZ [Gammaproteobacteria bacterium RIFCSPLOWO2_02_FULL_47_50]|jgi:sulfoxide reductase heme-binding subunit YedZ|nr:MAG: sulfoxide reductase heme-binding subunit YedZ [Gammaproteobacteria bacterium RIFCSPLOWO2_02_47_7]OGT66242.1 MAG: sulfoxide reductase heme-binding subunit YedZ [Gammaproteobacteria bacterium RIFCSPLOWO2_01_FULL_47_190]OGT76012.1 MAG: sulfoxide reductase heme-binding subunit YedZ [Gammaproteobacteria bacterium RIFCSPLOWO2_12_47_11]OGT79746.1 MAG: sulfoxide reductase heme-binding subunit YedZ [Gammaproteobacteria bacterium RIFCSPLOWO2_02_FULL_47_50]OGT87897.1 MAG: sulfoxide reductase heme-